MSGEAFGGAARPRTIVVDIWSDVMCPFCYMGDTIFENALARFEHRDAVEVRYHSFLLAPDLTADHVFDVNSYLSESKGIPLAQAAQMNAQLTERGRSLGLDYRFDIAKATDTRRAHELTHFAASRGLQHEMVRRLFTAYFTEGRVVSDLDTLAELAAEVGLPADEARAAVESGEFAQAVEADLAQAHSLGIRGVPFFVFDMTFAVSGAQPEDIFAQALDQAWNRESVPA